MVGVVGAGFVGKHVAAQLVADGESVTWFVRYPERVKQTHPHVSLVTYDLTALPESLPRLECLVCVAPIRLAKQALSMCERTYAKRVLFLSSTMRHSRFRSRQMTDVLDGEAVVESAQLPWTILRPSMIYGCGDQNVSVLRNRIQTHRILPVIGGGQRLVQPVHVDDVAAAVSSAVARRSAEHACFEVCGPEPMTYTQMLDAIAESVSRSPLKVYVPGTVALLAAWVMSKVSKSPSIRVDQVRRMAEDRHFDISETTRQVGFHPRSFEEGLRTYPAA